MKAITIQLLNEQHQIKCSDDEVDELKTATKFLNTKMLEIKQKFKSLDNNQVLLLAALATSRDFVKLQSKKDDTLERMNHIIESLESKIQNTLNKE